MQSVSELPVKVMTTTLVGSASTGPLWLTDSGAVVALDTRTLHFGLGDLGCDYTLELRWPDGTTKSYTPEQIGQNRFLTLKYPG